MAILNSILGAAQRGPWNPGATHPNFVLPPGIQPPTAPEAYGARPDRGHDPSSGTPGIPDGHFAGMDMHGMGQRVQDWMSQVGQGVGGMMHPGAVGGAVSPQPPAAVMAPKPAGYGNGIMGSVMKAFNAGGGAGGAGGGLDIAKLMAMLG